MTAVHASISLGYRTYALVLLTIVYMSNFADRMIFSVVAGQVKAEFGLSDLQMGLLGGMAFAILYTTLGIPIAMLADRTSRKKIIVAALSIWSIFTAVCGFARSPIELMLARFGVAFGEAGGSPPAQSLISDLFPSDKRATALAVFAVGAPLGYAVGLFVGGNIAAAYGWRISFYALGLPGLLLAVLVAFTLREPERGHSDPAEARAARRAAGTDVAPSLSAVLSFMASQKPLVHVIVGATVFIFVGYAGVMWNVQFLERSHGMSLADASNYLALMMLFASVAGTFLGGWLADVLGRRDRRWNAWIVALFFAFGMPFSLIAFSTDSTPMSLAFLAVPVFVAGAFIGPTSAMVQNLVGMRMRALAAAILLFVTNFIGMGGGPLLAGWLSDVFAADHGHHSLRRALFFINCLNIWGVMHFVLAARGLVSSYNRASQH